MRIGFGILRRAVSAETIRSHAGCSVTIGTNLRNFQPTKRDSARFERQWARFKRLVAADAADPFAIFPIGIPSREGSQFIEERAGPPLIGGRGVRLIGQSIDHFAGLGVVELLAGFALDGVGIVSELADAVAQAEVFFLQFVDLLAKLPVFGALLVPHSEA